MDTKIKELKVNDKVKKIDDLIYLIIDEVLPDNKYSCTIDSPDFIEGLTYIMDGNDIEYVRSPDNMYYLFPEVEVIGFEQAESLSEDFELKMEAYELIRNTEFPEYKKQIHFQKHNKVSKDVFIVYLTL